MNRLASTLLVLLILNVIDGVLTAYSITKGLATEANPVTAWFLDRGLIQFAAWKGFVMVGVAMLLWASRTDTRASTAARAGAGLYLAVVVFQAAVLLVIA